MSSADVSSLPRPSRARAFWVVLVLLVVAVSYVIYLQWHVSQLKERLVQEASSSASPLALCQTGRDRDALELNRLRKDLTDARDARIASEQKESVCLTQLGLARQRATVVAPETSSETTNP